MNFFSILFSILFIVLMGLFIYKSIHAIIKALREKNLNKENKGKTIEIKNDNKKEK